MSKCTDKNGMDQHFVFLFMPFGLSLAVHSLTKIFKPIMAKVQNMGIKYLQFIGDGGVVVTSKEECGSHLDSVYHVLEQA